MNTDNYYEVLGVSENATQEEIMKNYLKRYQPHMMF